MSLSELRSIRYKISTAFYMSFDSLSGEQRLVFSGLLKDIDDKITALEEF